MEDPKEYTKGHEFESLYKWTIGNIVVDSIHLCDKGVWMFSTVNLIIVKCSPFEVRVILPFFKRSLERLGKLSADFSSKIQIANTGNGEDAPFNIIVERFFTYSEFRMVFDDNVGRLSLIQKRFNDISHFLGLGNSQINTLP